MLNRYIKILFYVSVFVFTYGCCKSVICIPFSSGELKWLPYKDGEVIIFKSNRTGRKYKLTAQKGHELTHLTHNCLEAQNYCDSKLEFYLNSPDTLGIYCALESTNNGNKKNVAVYSVWFTVEDSIVFGENSSFILQTKTINGTKYSNLIEMSMPYNSKYKLYYAKGYGMVAYYNSQKDEWLYKQ